MQTSFLHGLAALLMEMICFSAVTLADASVNLISPSLKYGRPVGVQYDRVTRGSSSIVSGTVSYPQTVLRLLLGYSQALRRVLLLKLRIFRGRGNVLDGIRPIHFLFPSMSSLIF